jgi:hypothetical protein
LVLDQLHDDIESLLVLVQIVEALVTAERANLVTRFVARAQSLIAFFFL